MEILIFSNRRIPGPSDDGCWSTFTHADSILKL